MQALAGRVRLDSCAIHSLSRWCCSLQAAAPFRASLMSNLETAELSSRKPRRSSLVSHITLAEQTCTASTAAALPCMRMNRPVSRSLERPTRSGGRRGRSPWKRYRLATWSSSGSTAATSITWGFIQVPDVLFTRRVPDKRSHTEVSTTLITISTSWGPVVSGAEPWRALPFCRCIETYSLETRTKIMCCCPLRAATHLNT